ncbi:MAG: hypothetical protein WBE34_01685 [Candidatus Nitrosopolaris sp.]
MREGFSRHSTGGPVRMTNQDAPEATHTDNTWLHNEISRSTTIIASDKARDYK